MYTSKKNQKNIPFTLAQRITRIVSNPYRRKQRFKELTVFLNKCHYPDELIKNCIERAKAPFTNSNELTGLEEDTLVSVSTYIPNLPFDENYIRKRIEGVQTKRLKQAFNNTKLIFARRQPKNLKQLLTSSTFSSSAPQPTEIGIKHCGDKRCLLCRRNYLQLTDKIISPAGKLLFTIMISEKG